MLPIIVVDTHNVIESNYKPELGVLCNSMFLCLSSAVITLNWWKHDVASLGRRGYFALAESGRLIYVVALYFNNILLAFIRS